MLELENEGWYSRESEEVTIYPYKVFNEVIESVKKSR